MRICMRFARPLRAPPIGRERRASRRRADRLATLPLNVRNNAAAGRSASRDVGSIATARGG